MMKLMVPLSREVLALLKRDADDRGYVYLSLAGYASELGVNGGDVHEVLIQLKNKGHLRQNFQVTAADDSASVVLAGTSDLDQRVLTRLREMADSSGEVSTTHQQIASVLGALPGDVHESVIHLIDDGRVKKFIVTATDINVRVL